MKPEHIKGIREREVHKIYKRQREIWKAQRALGYIKLDKPIRHGWFKEIVLSSKIERYKSKHAILELHKVIQKEYWGRTKEEAHKKWLSQSSCYFIFRDFPTISKKQFNKLSPKAQSLCTPFHYRNERKKLKLRFYIRIPKAAYRIKYTRAYITHSKRIDPALESEEDLLWQKLLKNEYYNIHQRGYRWKDYYNISEEKKRKLKVKRKLKMLKKYAIEDLINENRSWEIN